MVRVQTPKRTGSTEVRVNHFLVSLHLANYVWLRSLLKTFKSYFFSVPRKSNAFSTGLETVRAGQGESWKGS